MKNIHELIIEDLEFKNRFWRNVAIFLTVAAAVLFGLFLASEFELNRAKRQVQILENGAKDYYCGRSENDNSN